jgi:hypothetical protein
MPGPLAAVTRRSAMSKVNHFEDLEHSDVDRR